MLSENKNLGDGDDAGPGNLKEKEGRHGGREERRLEKEEKKRTIYKA